MKKAAENELKEEALLEMVICFLFLADLVITKRAAQDEISPDFREAVLSEIRGSAQLAPLEQTTFDDILSDRIAAYLMAFPSAKSFGVFVAVSRALAGLYGRRHLWSF